jgi:hypothetical protein
MVSTSDVQTPPGETRHSHSDCCAFCGAGHGGGASAIDPPAFNFVSLQRSYQLVSWLEAADPMPTLRSGSNAQPRAPPLLT